ncbi:MAG: copper resistance protein CopC [Actinomycetota bacterium]
MRTRRTAIALAIFALVLLPAVPGWAHGAIRSAHPAQGSTVGQPPREVSVHLAEPAAKGSTLVVTDGCEREVGGMAQLDGEMLTTPIEDGRAGRWKVKVRSISSADGHVMRESFTFRVRGQKDCSEGSPDDDVELGEPQPPLENDETSFPVVPFALGTIVVIGLAIALRRSKS